MPSLLSRIFLLTLFLPRLAFAHSGHSHDEPQEDLTIGGMANLQAGFVSEDLDSATRPIGMRSDHEIYIQYRHALANGGAFGLVIELEADVTEDAHDQGLNADKTYLYYEGSLGRFEIGSTSDAAHHLGVDASRLARATGGIHGDWMLFANFPPSNTQHAHGLASTANDFIHDPTLPLHHLHGISEDANKISYYSPDLSGFRLGASYIPDSGDGGQLRSGVTGHKDFANVLNGGAAYSNQLGPVNFTLSATGERGQSELPGHENLVAYALGFIADWNHISWGASHGGWGTSLNHSPAAAKGHYWTVGAAYDFGKSGISLGWFESSYQRNELSVLSLGADYTPIPGLTPYAEINYIKMDPADAARLENDAAVILTGIILYF